MGGGCAENALKKRASVQVAFNSFCFSCCWGGGGEGGGGEGLGSAGQRECASGRRWLGGGNRVWGGVWRSEVEPERDLDGAVGDALGELEEEAD